jgi:uncharacterized protein with PIN domain
VRFAVDGMLGKLARWLRIAGHDTLYVRDLDAGPGEEDELLIESAVSQCRILLTADEALHRRALARGVRSVLVNGNDVSKQLLEISKSLGRPLRINFDASRCPVCNGILEQADPAEVPEDLWEKHGEFWRCSRCGKIYWKGKHWKSIIRTAERYEREVGRSLPRRGKASREDRQAGD